MVVAVRAITVVGNTAVAADHPEIDVRRGRNKAPQVRETNDQIDRPALERHWCSGRDPEIVRFRSDFVRAGEFARGDRERGLRPAVSVRHAAERRRCIAYFSGRRRGVAAGPMEMTAGLFLIFDLAGKPDVWKHLTAIGRRHGDGGRPRVNVVRGRTTDVRDGRVESVDVPKRNGGIDPSLRTGTESVLSRGENEVRDEDLF